MSPKEKAEELLEKFSSVEFAYEDGDCGGFMYLPTDECKVCALIVCEEFISILPILSDEWGEDSTEYSEKITDYWKYYSEGWEIVKEEVSKLWS